MFRLTITHTAKKYDEIIKINKNKEIMRMVFINDD